MEFYQKLDLLMSLTSTTNSKLAKALNVDSSLVSRWRRGIRTPSDFASVVIQIADFSAPRIQHDYQKKELDKMTDFSLNTLSEEALKEKIVIWLGTENIPDYAEENQISSLDIVRSSTTQRTSQKDRQETLLALGKAAQKAQPGGVLRVYMDNPALWDGVITSLDDESTTAITHNFDTLKLMIPASISYEGLLLLWYQVELFFGESTIYVSILNKEETDTFQHSILIANDYAMSSSFGFYGCSNTFTLIHEKKALIQENIRAFDQAFDGGQSGLTYLENYTIWRDLELFDRIFSIDEDTYYYGCIFNPFLTPPETCFEITQKIAGAKEISKDWFLGLQASFTSFVQSNKVYTAVRLFSPEEVAAGKIRAPNIPQLLGESPAIGFSQYRDILAYTASLYEQFENLHILLLEEDVIVTVGLQDAHALSIMKETKTGTITHHSYHRGIISAAKRALEEKFCAYEQENTRESILQELRNHATLFEGYLDREGSKNAI